MDDDYRVRLDIFEGPLDLLLYLIKKDEVDIYDISIERVTKQYMAYIDAFKMLNIELASEFIVMAATLMYIKSRTLLPKAAVADQEEDEEEDPRWDLIRQLVEYKKFKDAAGFLGRREWENAQVYAGLPLIEEPGEVDAPEPGALPDVGIFDLIRAFQRILKRFDEKTEFGEIVDDRFTVGDKIDYLLGAVAPGQSLRFGDLFQSATSRDEVIITFVALLELIKLRHFSVEQEDALGDIVLLRNENS